KMSNKLSFWDGQPVTAPVYPQMGDIHQMHPHSSGCGAGLWMGVAAMHHQCQQATGFPGGARTGAGQQSMAMPMPMQMRGMGDFRHLACPSMPASRFFGQHNGQFESCLEDAEAFSAYNGMNTSIRGGGANGDFW
ncbi:hypothetical protein KR038_006827, partial [Drosophila bunnanda]